MEAADVALPIAKRLAYSHRALHEFIDKARFSPSPKISLSWQILNGAETSSERPAKSGVPPESSACRAPGLRPSRRVPLRWGAGAQFSWPNGLHARSPRLFLGSQHRDTSSARITSLSLARRICARCCSPMRATITELALTGLWTRTRPCVRPLKSLAGCNHVPFLADFITNTSGSSFRYTQVRPHFEA